MLVFVSSSSSKDLPSEASLFQEVRNLEGLVPSLDGFLAREYFIYGSSKGSSQTTVQKTPVRPNPKSVVIGMGLLNGSYLYCLTFKI